MTRDWQIVRAVNHPAFKSVFKGELLATWGNDDAAICYMASHRVKIV